MACLVLAAAQSACSEPVTRPRVIGVYYDQWSGRDEPAMLRLFEDGSYLHSDKSKTQGKVTSSDRWEFSSTFGKAVVVLHNFSPPLPNQTAARRDWRLDAQEDYGMIRLYISHEPTLFYLGAPKGNSP